MGLASRVEDGEGPEEARPQRGTRQAGRGRDKPFFLSGTYREPFLVPGSTFQKRVETEGTTPKRFRLHLSGVSLFNFVVL